MTRVVATRRNRLLCIAFTGIIMPETPSESAADRIAHLENRITTIEQKRLEETRGWVAHLTRIGILVGCVGGILGGASTALQLWSSSIAKAQSEFSDDTDLEATLDREAKVVTFKWGLSANNKGEKPDSVKIGQVHLHSVSQSNVARTKLVLPSVELRDDKAKLPNPVVVGAHRSMYIPLYARSNLTEEFERVFSDPSSIYILSVEIASSTPDAPRSRTYCFLIGASLRERLTQGFLNSLGGSEPRCELPST